MTERQFIWDPDNTIDQKYGYLMFFASIISFTLLNVLVTTLGKPKNVKADSWKWNNLFISWIHGFVCGTWNLLCLCLYPELLSDLFHHINYFTYLMVAFSSGYFVYDFLDICVRKKIGSNWEVVLHHLAVGPMFWYNFHTKICIGFTVIALSVEMNSFFLHARKLLQMLQYKFDDKFYRLVCIVNLLTFAVVRGSSLTLITYSMFIDYDQVPALYFACLVPSMFATDVINLILFWKLFKNDILRYGESQKLRQKTNPEMYLNGNNNQSSHIKSN